MATTSRRTTPTAASLKRLSQHFRSLARDYPADFRDRIRAEVASSRLSVPDRVFVVSTLNAALRQAFVERQHAAEELRCSFCGKGPRELKDGLVQGTSGSICFGCIKVCHEMATEQRS